jgi:hypothetical protein
MARPAGRPTVCVKPAAQAGTWNQQRELVPLCLPGCHLQGQSSASLLMAWLIPPCLVDILASVWVRPLCSPGLFFVPGPWLWVPSWMCCYFPIRMSSPRPTDRGQVMQRSAPDGQSQPQPQSVITRAITVSIQTGGQPVHNDITWRPRCA